MSTLIGALQGRDLVLHPALEHLVAILDIPLGAVHGDVHVAQQILGAGTLAGNDATA